MKKIDGDNIYTSLNAISDVVYDIYVNSDSTAENPDGTEQKPYKYIEQALDYIESIKTVAEHDVNIHISGSFYYGEEPLWNKTTSRTINIPYNGSTIDTYKVTTGINIDDRYNLPDGCSLNFIGDDAVVSGGKRVYGWTLYDAEKNIYKSNVGTEENARRARQFYVNGRKAVRARSEGNLGSSIENQKQYITDANVMNYKNLQDIDFVYIVWWCSYQMSVDSIAEQEAGKYLVNLTPSSWNYVTNITSNITKVSKGEHLQYIENAYELLDSEGEYYIDSQTGDVFYKPFDNEDMATAEGVVPMVDELFNVEGTSLDNPVKNMSFSGITFTDTTWLRPNGKMGHTATVGNIIKDCQQSPQGAVNVSTVRNVDFTRCTFKNMGITGLNMPRNIQDCDVVGNVFNNISGTALVLCSAEERAGGNADLAADPRSLNTRNSLKNNYVKDIGLDFPSSNGFYVGIMTDSQILHNEIYNVSYSGISIGYGSEEHYVTKRNVVAYNRIEDVQTKGAFDGGGIYHSGYCDGDENTYGFLIKENYIKNNMKETASLYADNCSTWVIFDTNVVDTRLSQAPTAFSQTSSANCTFKNNYYTNGDFNDSPSNIRLTDSADSTYSGVSGNKYINNKKYANADWPEEAQNVIANCGLEDEYKDIRTVEGYNIITNGEFEFVSAPLTWSGSSASYSRTAEARRNGLYGGKISLTSSSGELCQNIKINTSKCYKFKIYAKTKSGSGNLKFSLKYDFYNYVLANNEINKNEWTEISGDTLSVPCKSSSESDATLCISFTGLAAGSIIYLDDCMMYDSGIERPPATPKPTFDPAG